MIPVLYLPNTTGFSSFGLGVLTDTAACEVTEERNGVFECLLKYPVSGQLYGLITKECVIKAKSNDTATDQAFCIYRITKPLKGPVYYNNRRTEANRLQITDSKPFRLLELFLLKYLSNFLGSLQLLHLRGVFISIG